MLKYVAKVRAQGRDRARAVERTLVASALSCVGCGTGLRICRNRHRFVETLDGLVHLRLKWKACPGTGCASRVTYRPAEEGRIVLKGHEFGLDVLVLAGEQYLSDRMSVARIHRRLRSEYQVPICERSVGNLVDDYVALCECVAGDHERLQGRLREQGAIVLAVDGVHFDGRSPVLYVLRDVLSGEVLYAERRVARSASDLEPMFRRVRDLAASMSIPIVGVVSDKERSLVPAIGTVFPGIPHQYCQEHYLGNLARPLADDDRQLTEGVQEVVYALRKIDRALERLGLDAAGAAGEKELVVPAGTSASAPDPINREAAAPHDAEAVVAQLLVEAGKTAGSVCGRPITDPAGLKRFRRLEMVRAAAVRAAQKRGLQRTAGR